MATVPASVGSFDKSSSNGVTAYGTTMYFTIPENAGITGCSVTFVTHNSGGHTQDRAFSLNGARAHSSGSWASSGIALNAALLSTGQNTFRVTLKSQAGAACWWDISSITLTITYTEQSGGGGGETRDPGTISISKTSLTAGESLTVSITGASSGVYRDVYIFKMPSSAGIGTVVQGHGSGAGSWTVNVPVSWCETHSPDDPSFEIKFYMVSYIAGGAVVGDGARMLTVNVPATAVPTIDDFTAVLNANGVDASITGYVQNYSKSDLEIVDAVGALGSTISSYEIIGGGWSANSEIATFGPFPQAGDITFIAKVTDTRGRTATKSVTISIMPYTPVSGSGLSAFRSDVSGDPADEGTYAAMKGKRVFGSLDSQNTAVIKGRVFEKGTIPPDWTSMSDDTLLLIGSLSIEKGYTVQIAIADKITSVIYIIEIPTAVVGMHILPGATGASFGMYAKEGWFSVPWPVDSSEGACPGIGDILYTLNPTHPAIRFPGTTWAAHEGVFLLGANETYEAGDTGGEATHVLTVAEMPTHNHPIWSLNWEVATGTSGAVATAYGAKEDASGNAGNGEAHNNMPPFLATYIWERTA